VRHTQAALSTWHGQRQQLLHAVCARIAQDRADGMKAMRAYRAGAVRFNRNRYARRRGKTLKPCSIMSHFYKWKETRSAEVFAAKWKSPSFKRISQRQIVAWSRRILRESISAGQLYKRLKVEGKAVNFSLCTLRRALPCRALREVVRARLNLARAERAALAMIGGKP